jgi:hypothetical protein
LNYLYQTQQFHDHIGIQNKIWLALKTSVINTEILIVPQFESGGFGRQMTRTEELVFTSLGCYVFLI